MPKKVTNEKLAQMIKNGFDEVHGRIDKVDISLNKKIDKVNINLNKKIDKIDKNLNYKIDHLKMKVDDIDKKLYDSFAKQDTHDIQIKDNEKRIVILEKRDKVLT